MKDIIIPTGISYGANMIRASKSQNNVNILPSKAVNGINQIPSGTKSLPNIHSFPPIGHLVCNETSP